jgi:hypothetical protein
VSCPLEESCEDGECRPDPCGGISCPDGEVCVAGDCAGDPCAGMMCPSGQRCVEGMCRFDTCDQVECPPGQACIIDQNGEQQCVFENQPEGRAPELDPQDNSMGPAGGAASSTPITPMTGNNPGQGDMMAFTPTMPTGGGAEPGADETAAEGCHCDLSDESGAPASWALLLALLLIRPRRRGPRV